MLVFHNALYLLSSDTSIMPWTIVFTMYWVSLDLFVVFATCKLNCQWKMQQQNF